MKFKYHFEPFSSFSISFNKELNSDFGSLIKLAGLSNSKI